MRAFIVRPFGIKLDHSDKPVDFDAVQKQLLEPALRQLGYSGRTTQEIAKAGNIREDMFRLLVTADLVIADISIHNANVFYELGIRHALRDKATFLIRCKADESIFDLQTDRYLAYDRDKPADSLPNLIQALEQTRNARKKDSPVFLLLPRLEAQRRSRILLVPPDFEEETRRASAERRAGDLSLLGQEAGGFEWESEGLRLVGRAQFDLNAFAGAKVTWERLREIEPDDQEADTRLGTIYQKLSDLARSDEAIRRALTIDDLRPEARAELMALLGSNAKARWKIDLKDVPEPDRRAAALRSRWLQESKNAYIAGFEADLNHFFSGLNALAMLTIETELAMALPDIWEEQFDAAANAESALKERTALAAKLSIVIERSLSAAQQRLDRLGKSDIWVSISQADLRLLTSDRPRSVGDSYRRVLAGAPDFPLSAVRAQLTLYRPLGIRAANVDAALAAFPLEPPTVAASVAGAPQSSILVFTGHRIDAPGRDKPRFPASKEGVARDAIRAAVQIEQSQPGGVAFGIAGAASGGDILFHEVCKEQAIPTRLFLALPPEFYIPESVAPAGHEWVERFRTIYNAHAELRCELSPRKELPAWLREKADYDIWRRTNLWMLHNAVAFPQHRVTLIALWDGGIGDGPGGTEHMWKAAQDLSAKTIKLDTRVRFGL